MTFTEVLSAQIDWSARLDVARLNSLSREYERLCRWRAEMMAGAVFDRVGYEDACATCYAVYSMKVDLQERVSEHCAPWFAMDQGATA